MAPAALSAILYLAIGWANAVPIAEPETHVSVSIFDLVHRKRPAHALGAPALDRAYVEKVIARLNQSRAQILACLPPESKLKTGI